MSETIQQFSPAELSRIFARLTARQVEEFHAAYQNWLLQQQIARVQHAMELQRAQLLEMLRQEQIVQPSPLVQASLALLQSKGVSDLDLLDRMLERGEGWLDATMERLERCEQLGFIHNNYTEWCQHALEDAYDWIDSMEPGPEGMRSVAAMDRGASAEGDERSAGANEVAEELLAKLASGDEGDFSQITLKMRAVPVTPMTALEEPSDEGGLLMHSPEPLLPEDGTAHGSIDTEWPGRPIGPEEAALNDGGVITIENEEELPADGAELERGEVLLVPDDSPTLQVELEAPAVEQADEAEGEGQAWQQEMPVEAGEQEVLVVQGEERELPAEAQEHETVATENEEQQLVDETGGHEAFVVQEEQETPTEAEEDAVSGVREKRGLPVEEEEEELPAAMLQGSERGVGEAKAGESELEGVTADSSFEVDEAPAHEEERKRMLPAVVKQKPPLSYMLPRLPLLFLRKIFTGK